MIVHLIHDDVLVVDLSNTFFDPLVVEQRALHVYQLVVADDECDIYMSDYVDTCPENLVTVFDKFWNNPNPIINSIDNFHDNFRIYLI